MHEKEEFQKKMNPDSLTHPAEFMVKPKGQTVWEGKNVTLHCTVAGWPKPRVAWYKNNVPIDAKGHPDKYTVESNYNMHSLEIKRCAGCDFMDTAEYRASALNVKGESSSFASVVVKSTFVHPHDSSALALYYSSHFHTFLPRFLPQLPLSYLHVPKWLPSMGNFGVSFGHEGETMSLGCTVIIYPNVKRYQPDVLWYRDNVLLKPSKWVNMHWSGEKAMLTLVHLNKEDEGLYTLRVNTKSGFETHSAYVFVRDADVEEEGVPVAPLDVRCHDANKDYVVVTWKQPAVEGSSSILGYFIDRCEVGTKNWVQCNDTPVTFARFPVTGLVEGRSYYFRVRAINRAGESRPSRVSDPVAAVDPSDRAHLPSTPGPVVATRNTATSVVVSWGASKEVKRLVGYYIEVGVEGSNVWVPCNNKPVKCTRFVCHGLTTGEKCVFRVKAVNAAGYSDSSAASEALLCSAIPAPPTGVTLAERFQGYMVLSWQAPTKTGGADIRGYYLDYRTVKDGVADGWHDPSAPSASRQAVDLKENKFYQFQVRAANMAGLSVASPPSAPLECKEWTVAVPGPAHGLHVLEVRKHSLVLLWETPAFNGRSAVTGYYVDIKEASASDGCWKGVNERSTQKHYLKVAGLKEGVSYVLRVSAKNIAGVGIPCEPLGPIVAETRPGTNEIVVDVDDDGVISMIFECSEMREGSQFVWSRDYEALTDTSRLNIQTAGGRSRAIFTDLSAEDLGSYSCMVTNTDGFSSSYTLTEEDLKRLLDLSFEHKFPVIPFKSEMAIELQEKGRVRFWAQVAKFTSGCQVEYKYTMHFDKSTGIIEMFMDLLEVTDEGTFTFNLVDGKATGRTSLVLIGEEFAALQKKSEFERAEWVRRQGPHFVEYLGFEVTAECNVHLKCKIGNIKPETEITWFKDAIEIEEEDEAAKHITAVNGVLTFDIGKVKLKDERGKDKSLFDLTGKGDAVSANSATELSVQSTEHGIILHTSVVYYTEELPASPSCRDAKISHSDRVQCGVSGEQLWLKINEPTEKDKGKYGINIFDGKDGVKRVFDLTGQAWEEAYEEFKRLNPSEHFYSLPHTDRARVVGGLPDVVTIQEGKSLNLTGNVWGDPAPEVSWLKNDRELKSDEHYTLKFEHGKYASITIAAVTTVDSGKYALQVKNKYGTEAMPFTVSVYFPEDEEVKGDKKE
uniref:Myomesin 1a (skelemin) n=1 Tax=Denticeps clupeoides TaxID=299321 RepID=A0AAY4ACI2_9TELE